MSDFLDEKIDLFLEQLPHKERNDRIVRENFYRIKQYCDKLRYTINNLYVSAPEDPVYAYLAAHYTTTDVWTDITNLSLTIPSDGLYDLKFEGQAYAHDVNGTSACCAIAIGSDSTTIPKSGRMVYHTDDTVAKISLAPFSTSVVKHCVKNEVITGRAKRDAGDNSLIHQSNDKSENYIMYRKLGYTLEGI